MATKIEGDAPIAHYCGLECQQEHWTSHELTCIKLKDRTLLYRVIDTAQKLFFIHREMTWHEFDVDSVQKIEGHLVLRGTYFQDHRFSKDYKQFPSNVVPQEHRRAVLSFNQCRYALLWVVEFIEDMLKDIVSVTQTVLYKTKNDKLRTRIYGINERLIFNSEGIKHHILRVLLRSGEEFAVDITGAQYGYDDAVTPWEEYAQLRVFDFVLVPGTPAMNLLQTENYSLGKTIELADKFFNYSPEGKQIHQGNLLCMNMGILNWQRYVQLSLKELWKLPTQIFERKQKDLVDYVEWATQLLKPKYTTENGRRLVEEVKGNWVHDK
ncbi:hypothetical protein BDZ45DRAFT_761761 [Acephala macrosclerotiorum]|nr:hypothetical protein BDZ45DRAFT_761761 [Acephala macrosclerotiorum]